VGSDTMKKFLEGLMGPKINDIDWKGEFKVALGLVDSVDPLKIQCGALLLSNRTVLSVRKVA